ncbi:hypothetical protein [Paraconexibacter algicola]|uniref:hypothetical protein n=1 Tax=Paraconexibacter algicola TaxID=2133960 RepID=UPI001304CFF1|nr:hypothetical protein [Paraconexibacter algicola]
MTRLEFVADRLRVEFCRLRHVPAPLRWDQLQPSERSQWLRLASAALDADCAWRP